MDLDQAFPIDYICSTMMYYVSRIGMAYCETWEIGDVHALRG